MERLNPKKKCNCCNQHKHLTEFYKDRFSSDGLYLMCKKCSNEYYKKYNTYCSSEKIEKIQETEWRETISEKIHKGWEAIKHKKQQNTRNKDKYKEKRLKYFYGISLQEYNKIFENQNGCCAICGEPQKQQKALAVDHNHITGKIRGLLCPNCNRGIGYLKDNSHILQKAIQYLDKYQ